MTFTAQSDAVRHVEPPRWVDAPRDHVVSVHVFKAPMAALATGVVVAAPHGVGPRPDAWAARLYPACLGVASGPERMSFAEDKRIWFSSAALGHKRSRFRRVSLSEHTARLASQRGGNFQRDCGAFLPPTVMAAYETLRSALNPSAFGFSFSCDWCHAAASALAKHA